MAEQLGSRLDGRFSQSDWIKQKITKTWRGRAPHTSAVLKQDEVV
jgi:hypothetical protein